MKKSFFVLLLFIQCSLPGQNKSDYDNLKLHLNKGWNTWDTRSVLRHVLLPQGLAISLQLKDDLSSTILTDALIGRRGKGEEIIRAGAHAYNGSYTELQLQWRGININVQSATSDNQLVMLIQPETGNSSASLIILPEMLWNRPGLIKQDGNGLLAELPGQSIRIFVTGKILDKSDLKNITMSLNQPVGISTLKSLELSEIQNIIAAARQTHVQARAKYGDLAEAYAAMQTVLAWDVIYEPTRNRIIAPVSRLWNINWNGWVLFDWDTYFASYMLSLDSKELACSNAIAITDEITPSGFIPNFGSPVGTVWTAPSRPSGRLSYVKFTGSIAKNGC